MIDERDTRKTRKKRLIKGSLILGTLLFFSCLILAFLFVAQSRATTSKTQVTVSHQLKEKKQTDAELIQLKQPTNKEKPQEERPFSVKLDSIQSSGRFLSTKGTLNSQIQLAFSSDANGTEDETSTGTITFTKGKDTTIYLAKYVSIPTKAMKIYNGQSGEIRTVLVNTAIVPTALVKGEEIPAYQQSIFAYYTNMEKEVALASPNHEQNIPKDEQELLIEFVSKK